MPKFAVEPEQLRKITGSAATLARGRLQARLTAIIQVAEEGYVPPCVSLRSRIDDTMFTAELSSDRLEELDGDPKVKSVSVSRKLNLEN